MHGAFEFVFSHVPHRIQCKSSEFFLQKEIIASTKNFGKMGDSWDDYESVLDGFEYNLRINEDDGHHVSIANRLAKSA